MRFDCLVANFLSEAIHALVSDFLCDTRASSLHQRYEEATTLQSSKLTRYPLSFSILMRTVPHAANTRFLRNSHTSINTASSNLRPCSKRSSLEHKHPECSFLVLNTVHVATRSSVGVQIWTYSISVDEASDVVLMLSLSTVSSPICWKIFEMAMKG
jgi:hypothetical protein